MATNTHREHSLDAIATAEACLHNDGETLTVLLDHADNRACACMPRAGGRVKGARSGAAGILDTAARERIMPGGREAGRPWCDADAVTSSGLLAFLCEVPAVPAGGGIEADSGTWVRGAWALPRRQDD